MSVLPLEPSLSYWGNRALAGSVARACEGPREPPAIPIAHVWEGFPDSEGNLTVVEEWWPLAFCTLPPTWSLIGAYLCGPWRLYEPILLVLFGQVFTLPGISCPSVMKDWPVRLTDPRCAFCSHPGSVKVLSCVSAICTMVVSVKESFSCKSKLFFYSEGRAVIKSTPPKTL